MIDNHPLTMRQFVHETGSRLFDLTIIIFCGLMAALLTFGLGLSRTRFFFVIALMFLLFATSAFMKYATMVTRSIALGQTAPVAENAVFDYLRDLWAFAPWLGLLVVNAVGIAIWQQFGHQAALVFVVVMAPMVPAGIAVVCLSRRPWQMFHVPGLIRVVRVMGRDYLKILMMWLLLAGLGFFFRAQPGFAYSFIAVWIGCTQVMALFIATGVVVFHHHEALGVPIERASKADRQQTYESKRVLRERRTALDEAYSFFSRGNEVAGLARLKHYLDEHIDDDIESWGWFVDEMMTWESKTPYLLLARNYFSRLAVREDDSAARTLLVSCQSCDPRFKVHAKDQAYADTLMP